MARYFTADLHLGHRNIIDYSSRPFRDRGADVTLSTVSRIVLTVRADG